MQPLAWILLAAGLVGAAVRAYSGLHPESGIAVALVGPGGHLLDVAVTALLCAGAGLALGRWTRPNEAPDRWLLRWRLVRAVTLCAILVMLFAAAAIYVYSPPHTQRVKLMSLGFVTVFSGLIGFAELTERYRDDPARLFAADPTIIYVAVNVAAGVGALALIEELDVFSGNPHEAILRVLLASFGSIAFFRTSLFTARVGDKDVDVGPATLLKSLLNTSDRMINRSQARDRADDADRIMRGVDFDKAKAALPAFCFTAVENITEKDQREISDQILTLQNNQSMDGAQRTIILGIYLIRLVGPVVLARAVLALGASIR